jgi:hypothetical protein
MFLRRVIAMTRSLARLVTGKPRWSGPDDQGGAI